MLQAAVGISVSAVERSVRYTQKFSCAFHFQVFVFDGVHDAFREGFLPELLSSSGVEIIVHFYNVGPVSFQVVCVGCIGRALRWGG